MSVRGTRALLAACTLLVACAGCREAANETQVMVEVDAEHAVRARIRDVDFEVHSGQGPIESWTPRYAKSLTAGSERGQSSVRWPLEVALVPRAGQTERNYVAVATARDERGAALARVRVISGYVDGKSLRLPLLFDGACFARTDLCSDELTCRAGECVDPRVDPVTLLPFSDTPTPMPDHDAGREPAARDAGDDGGGDGGLPAGSDAGAGPVTGSTCTPGSPGCAALTPVSVEDCPDRRCEGCPQGFVKDEAEACVPLLTGLGVSSGTLVPALNAIDTRYALELGLLAEALVITPLASDDVRIEIDGMRLGSGEQFRLDTLPLGQRVLVITLSHADGGARTYTIDLERAGAQRTYLKAGEPAAGDGFGRSVAFDGETIAVGAPNRDSGSGASAANESGAAYVFARDGASFGAPMMLSATTPRTEAHFGTAIAVDGDTIAIGAPEDSGGGAVYVFVRDGAGADFREQARLTHPVPASDLRFGASLALAGNTLLVGSPGDDRDRVDSGAVFFFTRDGSLWGSGTRLAPMAPQAAAWFGSSVALDGERLAVGATGESGSSFTSGAAYVFERSGAGFRQQARVVAGNPGVADLFGDSVALAGDTLAVGAVGASTSQGSSGAVYLFAREGDDWPQTQQLAASNPSFGAGFGSRIALAGDILVTGASEDDSGAVGIGSDGSGAGRENSGAGYVFVRRGGRFEQLALLKADAPDPGDLYGFAVALAGDTIAIGAEAEASSASGVGGDALDNSARGAGAVYVVR
ncbi:MAG TPA: hypothetical protein VK509_15920 [Polyangiales bacterium]|nr:hypothetical protein [Polyangiales bacterium]